ncbi:MAG: YlmH/Sll1252 family protein [Bacillota bacterium]|jgi:RNA-binding protein YlmH|nr:YlmH/Sll1252 family protein [Bacillota bacterium]HHU30119.1 hypothetical protein [Bacillota bacterium]
MDREKIIQLFDDELSRRTAAVILDHAARAEQKGKMQLTDFLDPFQQRTADKVMHYFKGLKQVSWGGYASAERVRVLIFPAKEQLSTADVPLAYAAITLGASDAGITHRDYLGALLALGLRREKIGDIIVLPDGAAQVVLHPEIISYVLANLQKVGKYNARVEEITAESLTIPAGRTREIMTTVASLRLDAVAGSGFGVSRSKMVPVIRAGHVKVNWQSAKNAGMAVKAGDVISVAGRGRIEIAEILGESKKGRIRLLLKKHF